MSECIVAFISNGSIINQKVLPFVPRTSEFIFMQDKEFIVVGVAYSIERSDVMVTLQETKK